MSQSETEKISHATRNILATSYEYNTNIVDVREYDNIVIYVDMLDAKSATTLTLKTKVGPANGKMFDAYIVSGESATLDEITITLSTDDPAISLDVRGIESIQFYAKVDVATSDPTMDLYLSKSKREYL